MKIAFGLALLFFIFLWIDMMTDGLIRDVVAGLFERRERR